MQITIPEIKAKADRLIWQAVKRELQQHSQPKTIAELRSTLMSTTTPDIKAKADQLIWQLVKRELLTSDEQTHIALRLGVSPPWLKR